MYHNQQLEKEGVKVKTVALILCISCQRGIEGYFLRNGSITKQEVAFLISTLQEQSKGAQRTIFIDNLRSNYSHVVRDQLTETGWEVIYNAPYSSPFHCIEFIFAKIKHLYR